MTSKKLVDAARHRASMMKKAGFSELPDVKDCYVATFVGDLLHVSNFEARQKNLAELVKRVEKLARACLPIIERAAGA
jgi:hypothetical protein